jgi:hypothetical protein
MSPEMQKRLAVLSSTETQVVWCDDVRFGEENAPGVSPGDHLNRFGWFVLGTTIGGNAIVAREDDPAIYFADHTWYHDSGVHYQNLGGDRSWISAPLAAESVRKSLFKLSESASEFVQTIPEIDSVIDRID